MRPTALRLSTRGTCLFRPQPLVRAPLLAARALNLQPSLAPRARHFSHISPRREAKDPVERGRRREYKAAELSDGEYHDLSDYYLDLISTKYEDLQDTRTDVDVEFAAGVITITIAPIGTYVINKQPPNKEIWLSSPISGPKRYGYFIAKDRQDNTEAGSWLYYRDFSSLHELLLKETGVDLDAPADHSDQ